MTHHAPRAARARPAAQPPLPEWTFCPSLAADILPISLLHPPRDTKSVGPTPLPKARVGCAWHTVFVYRLSSPFSSPRAQDPTLACNEHLELVRALMAQTPRAPRSVQIPCSSRPRRPSATLDPLEKCVRSGAQEMKRLRAAARHALIPHPQRNTGCFPPAARTDQSLASPRAPLGVCGDATGALR